MLYVLDTGIITLRGNDLVWDIDKLFSLPLIVGCEINSKLFMFAGSQFRLVLWPRGLKGADSEDWFGICLYKHGARNENGPVTFSISINNRTIRTCTVEFSDGVYRKEKFMQWSDFNELKDEIASNGRLTIVCRMRVEEDQEDAEITSEESFSGFEPISPLHSGCIAFQSGDYASANHLSVNPYFKNPTEIQSTLLCGHKFENPSTINAFFSSTGSAAPNKPPSYHEVSSESQASKCKMFTVADDHTTERPEPEDVTGNFGRFFSRMNKRGKPKESETEFHETKTAAKDETSTAFLDECSEMMPESNPESPVVPTTKPREIVIDSGIAESDSERAACGSPTFAFPPCFACAKKAHCESKSALLDESQKKSESVSHTNRSRDSKAKEHSSGLSGSDSSSFQSEKICASSLKKLKSLEVMSEHYKRLYLESIHFNLTIVMEGRKFRVHKDILGCRSPVFAALLSQEVGENRGDTISIDPFDACNKEVFHDFLLYVYSGYLENLSIENVYGLYYAADQYEMFELKEACIEFLKESVSVETISDVIRLAVKKEEYELLDIATVFYAMNLKEIMVTDKWQKFIVEDVARYTKFQLDALNIYTKAVA